MVMALIAKNKTGYIDGTIKTPDENDEKYHFWLQFNNMLLSWILNSVSNETASGIIFIEIA